ncbi:MAG: hypothetical protein IIY30_02635, partial [Erysipelotrichaceae bacterium]|nr:hypothetical protein [Erysipelotrichaceae bacterium]
MEENSTTPIETESSAEPTEKAKTRDEVLAKAPKSYEFAVRLTFGPDFVFYMAENGDVFAFEALNESAKKLEAEGKLTILGRSISDATASVLKEAAQGGMIQNGNEIKLMLLSTNQPESTAKELLFQVNSKVQEQAKTAGVEIKPVIEIDQTVQFAPEPVKPEESVIPEDSADTVDEEDEDEFDEDGEDEDEDEWDDEDDEDEDDDDEDGDDEDEWDDEDLEEDGDTDEEDGEDNEDGDDDEDEDIDDEDTDDEDTDVEDTDDEDT